VRRVKLPPVAPRGVRAAVSTSRRQVAALRETAHRPWPLPRTPWVMGQTWERLLFAHWEVDAALLGALVPPGLELDTYEGRAWIGVTPFRVVGLRPRRLPPVPRLSTFLETNVRTYVTRDGRPGILFFSLDASSLAAVAVARATYRLPYFPAEMRLSEHADAIDSSTRRRGPGRRRAFAIGYRVQDDVAPAEPGTLEHFLVERYCLYAAPSRGPLLRADIHHAPWPLQRAEAVVEENTLTPQGLDIGGPPLCHFAVRQDVVVWPPLPVR
jgi:uncharacterized protein